MMGDNILKEDQYIEYSQKNHEGSFISPIVFNDNLWLLHQC
jgi:hypothetical protein